MKIRRLNPNAAVMTEEICYQAPVPDGKPRHILEEIVWHKETEVAKRRDRLPLLELRKQVETAPPPLDFKGALEKSDRTPALIAEVKKASPSKGVIREDFDPVAIAQAYERGGASCLSVLTDAKFFQGSFENLALVRQAVSLPLLCKEFILYPYQIFLARTQGADAILLIAAILSDQDLTYFVKIIRNLGMTPLVEVHSLQELDRVLAIDNIDLIGINNRNLSNFSVHLQTTQDLIAARQSEIAAKGCLIVSESGLHQPEDLRTVEAAGAGAVLIGESLVRQPDPAAAIEALYRFAE